MEQVRSQYVTTLQAATPARVSLATLATATSALVGNHTTALIARHVGVFLQTSSVFGKINTKKPWGFITLKTLCLVTHIKVNKTARKHFVFFSSPPLDRGCKRSHVYILYIFIYHNMIESTQTLCRSVKRCIL